ncbi:unnamed protein product [Oikopleura dioica]|uniref:glycerophosphodiester phosphodiesterase n=1 Tax=Oikopleura dioica TaxID=34765 RepID=E4Y5F6_OIKDI|nr:unnamed protein product [Oikopleura dioica]
MESKETRVQRVNRRQQRKRQRRSSKDHDFDLDDESFSRIVDQNEKSGGRASRKMKRKKFNLKVHSWVSRNEGDFLLWDYGLDAYAEYEDLIEAGVDGLFTDFPASLANYLSLRRENTCLL